jgi:hypothetical protein
MEVSLNKEQQLYIVSSGNSVSCIGFNWVYVQGCELVRRLRSASEKTLRARGLLSLRSVDVPSKEQIGTLEQYEQYRVLMSGYTKLGDEATWFDSRTPRKVQRALESVRKSGDRVRLFYGDAKTGVDRLEQHDTVGKIGRSTGVMKLPLIITDDCGGPLIYTQNIVRILNLTTGEELYRHKKYRLPRLELREAEPFCQLEGYKFAVMAEDANGELTTQANFTTQVAAACWLSFMAGYLHDLPND